MRCEELAYNYQLEKLRQSVREASINEVILSLSSVRISYRAFITSISTYDL